MGKCERERGQPRDEEFLQAHCPELAIEAPTQTKTGEERTNEGPTHIVKEDEREIVLDDSTEGGKELRKEENLKTLSEEGPSQQHSRQEEQTEAGRKKKNDEQPERKPNKIPQKGSTSV